jgi:thiol-disulfide isomerase/thioredoxin
MRRHLAIPSTIALALILAQSTAMGHDDHNHGKKPGDKHPKMVIEGIDHDFGEIWIGGVLEHHFAIRNDGDAPLELVSVKPTCGCTVAKHDRIIQPGTTGRITAALKTSKVANGKFTKNINVITNDIDQRKVKLTLNGLMRHYVITTPSIIDFGDIRPRDEATQTVTLTNQSDRPMALNLPGTTIGTNFTAEIIEKKPGFQFDLVVKSHAPYRRGNIAETVKILTNLPEQKQVQLALRGRILARLDVSPQLVVIPDASDVPVDHKVKVVNYGNSPVHVQEVTSTNPRIHVSFEEVQAGQEYLVHAKVPAGYRPGVAGETVQIKTDDPLKQVLEVSVRRTQRPPKQQELLVGKPAPAFEFTTHAGHQINSASTGEILVLKFYKSWDRNCRASLPRLEALHQKYKDQGVRFVGISIDKIIDPNNPPHPRLAKRYYSAEKCVQALKDLGVTFDFFFDYGQKIGKPIFKVTAWPSMFIIDRKGQVVKFHAGQVTEERFSEQSYTVDDFDNALSRLVEGKELIDQ